MIASSAVSSVKEGSGRKERKDFEAGLRRSLMCRRSLGAGRVGGWWSFDESGWELVSLDGRFGIAEGREVVSVIV